MNHTKLCYIFNRIKEKDIYFFVKFMLIDISYRRNSNENQSL